MSDPDYAWMQHALALAERGRGFVEPNPLVGAVVIRDGSLVGEGWHRRFGEAHAEVHALAAAGEAARGATLYVTLEPCCHHGKTPPCTDTILRSGVRRVVAAMADPFPLVAGGGLAKLREAGIEVEVGVRAADAHRLNDPYLTLLARARPYVHLKWAMSLDGKIATRAGESKWISNEASRRRVQELRGRMDGILVGIGTALADDPLLTARPPGPRVARRIVLDSAARLPPSSQLVRSALETPTLVVTSDRASAADRAALTDRGCECVTLAGGARPSVAEVLAELGRRRFTNVLVEGGSAVLGSFVDAGFVDEVHVFIAPKLIGGDSARSPLGAAGIERMADALQLVDVVVESIEGDVYVRGRRSGSDASAKGGELR